MRTQSNTISLEGPRLYNLLYITIQARWHAFRKMASKKSPTSLVSTLTLHYKQDCCGAQQAFKLIVLKEDIWENSSFRYNFYSV